MEMEVFMMDFGLMAKKMEKESTNIQMGISMKDNLGEE